MSLSYCLLISLSGGPNPRIRLLLKRNSKRQRRWEKKRLREIQHQILVVWSKEIFLSVEF